MKLGKEDCNITKCFNIVRETGDSTKAFLENLEVQILKTLSTWHNSTGTQIRALHHFQVTLESFLVGYHRGPLFISMSTIHCKQ